MEVDLSNFVATFLDDDCLSRFEFRVPKVPVDMFELEKLMVKMFGQQPASQTDAVTEFYNRKQLPGENFRDFYTNLWILARNAFVYTGNFEQSRYDYLVKERFITGLSDKAVFWRVDVSNPQTCSEAYDLVVQTYARLQILNRNQHNPIGSEKMGDKETSHLETQKLVSWPDQIDQYNNPSGEKVCFFCGKKGHWGADCYLRKNQMNESSPKMREQFEQPISQGNGKLCLHCGKPGHLIADCYSRKNQMKLSMLGNKNRAEQSLSNQVINQIMFDKSIVRTLEMNSKPVSFLLDTGTVSTIVAKRIWDHCKTPDAALEPLDETLETCVGGPVKVIGKGKCSVKLISFESEVEIIVVDELVNDCLLGLDVAFKIADIKDYLECIRSALSKNSIKILTCNFTKVPDIERNNYGTVEEPANIWTK
ncbi:zf-CCHC domain containing [Brachionus plicatilis]|uniref:Zf-CCHC domain containing n=1 Tax=Brachionus plicatilis TaxID=10195 RepID=A0A3M7RQ36_BRAPC|nr:zf-CCHC domain containing [Brachionus plicatilis]